MAASTVATSSESFLFFFRQPEKEKEPRNESTAAIRARAKEILSTSHLRHPNISVGGGECWR